jgi:mRNA-degrading endonuclease RelE of RelBE toxin-antitoxin system
VVAYQLLIKKRALEFLNALPEKSRSIVIDKCKTLADDPFPGHGDKELIRRKGHKDLYRLHISRSFTAFYKIYKEEKVVRIMDILSIEEAHKRYGRFKKE